MLSAMSDVKARLKDLAEEIAREAFSMGCRFSTQAGELPSDDEARELVIRAARDGDFRLAAGLSLIALTNREARAR